ncbi:MAG TPA: ATP-dependent zinc metalloprotease FtsH [Chthoniobacterales bacterium]|nr:ATP-dependent zinc metalloprotease FtsH [Chthoniobacterales bacterium]
MKREPQINLPIKKPAKVDQPEPRWRWSIIYFLFTMLILWGWQDLFYQMSVRTIPYSEFKSYLARHEVVAAVVKQNEIDGRIVPKTQTPEPSSAKSPATENQKPESSPSAALNHEGQRSPTQTQPFLFRTERVEDPDLVKELQAANVEYAAARPGIISQLLVGWVLPLIVMIAIWTFVARRLNPSGQSIFSIGKSRARLVADRDTGVTFEDVAGCDEAKFELKEVVDFLKSPKQYEDLGARIPKGVLLVGPPGTGKTLLARAVAGEAKVAFFSISGSDFVEMFVGVGAARVRDLFKQAKEHAPCIIFIDELDAIGRQRGVHVGAVNDEREQTLNALLVEMDGFEPNAGVIILAATNRPEVLDRALLRPGRFDRQVVVDAPDLDGREAVLKVHSKNKHLAADVDLRRIAAATAGLSGADLANLLNEAALLAARRQATEITQRDLEDAIEKVVAGPERKSRRLGEEEKRRVAYHEVGHALVAAYSLHADPIHKISIVPRGRGALGYTMQLPSEDQFLMTRSELMDRIRGLLGGRAAEEVVFAEVSTGAQNDLERATALARQMVALYGMSERVGLANCVQRQSTFLNSQEFQLQRDCSEETAREIDEEVKKLLDQAYDQAKETLSAHRDQLEHVAAELLKSESIDGPTFYRLVGKEVPAFGESGSLAAVAAGGSERQRTTANVSERQ